jgi:hypothetical protein
MGNREESKARLERVLELFERRLDVQDDWQAEWTEHLVQVRETGHANANALTGVQGQLHFLAAQAEVDGEEWAKLATRINGIESLLRAAFPQHAHHLAPPRAREPITVRELGGRNNER